MTPFAPGQVPRRPSHVSSRVIQVDRKGVLLASDDSPGRCLYNADIVERLVLQREGCLATGRRVAWPTEWEGAA